MKPLTVYECEHCKKLFRTPNKHQCKKNPALKNCFTCKHLKGWKDGEKDEYQYNPPYPDCEIKDCSGGNGWDLEEIKECNYNMQCEHWEQGQYDHDKEFFKEIDKIGRRLIEL